MDSTGVDAADITDVTLRVADLPRALAFYQDVLGLARVKGDERVALSPDGRAPALIVLAAAPEAPPRPRQSAGLFHVAILYPDTAALGRILRRLLEFGVPIGSADHGVSQALYLADLEGNGLELYVDRPRERWPLSADGGIAMFTDALAFAPLLEAGRPPGPLMPTGTRVGHIHLSVASLANANEFYATLLGFSVTQRTYPGALFLARGGYHHHIGANVWHSRTAAQPGVLGLDQFTIRLDDAEFEAAARRLDAAGRTGAREARTLVVEDLDGLRVRLTTRHVPGAS